MALCGYDLRKVMRFRIIVERVIGPPAKQEALLSEPLKAARTALSGSVSESQSQSVSISTPIPILIPNVHFF